MVKKMIREKKYCVELFFTMARAAFSGVNWFLTIWSTDQLTNKTLTNKKFESFNSFFKPKRILPFFL